MSVLSLDEELELVRQYKADGDSLPIIRQYENLIFHTIKLVLNFGADPLLIEVIDFLKNDVIIDLLDHGLEEWDHKKGLNLTGWIRLFSKRRALDYLEKCDIYNQTIPKNQLTLETIFQKPSNENTEKKAIARIILKKIPKGINKVKPPRYQLILKLSLFDEKQADEIAKIIGTSTTNVYRMKSLALEQLRKIVGYY